jgi:predicted RNA-binding protein with TRAM domain
LIPRHGLSFDVQVTFGMATWHELKPGDEVDLEIKNVSRLGEGVGRVNGCLVFVKGAKAGDKLRVRITSSAARHAHAEIVKPSQEQEKPNH